MKTTMKFAALLVASASYVACSPAVTVTALAPAPATPLPESVRALRMFVADAQGLGNHAQLAQALESRLQSSGVATTNVGAPRDVDAVLVADGTGLQLHFVTPDGSKVDQLSSVASDASAWTQCLGQNLLAPTMLKSVEALFLIPVSEPHVGNQVAQGMAVSPAATQPDCQSIISNVVADLVGQMSRSQALAQLSAPPSPPAPTPGATPVPKAIASTAPPASVTSPSAAPSLVPASPQPTAYAIVIGIEKYSASLPPPTGARSDAQRFSELARASLGLSADHVQTLFDEQATKGSIERALASAQASVPSGGRIYFYFSGHGAPDASAGTPYIVPTDGDPQFLDATAIPMKEVLTKLGQSKAREVLAIVDSCFSGAGGRSVLPPGARPIVRVKEEAAPAQLALFSASSGSEISGPTSSGDGGLFTQFVLQGLGTGAADMNGDGQVSLGELSQWVAPRVSREAKKANRDQNPSLTVGKGLGSADSFIVEWGLAAR